MIVEREHAFTRGLRALVAFACDQNNISRLCFSQGQRNGLATIGLGDKARLGFAQPRYGLLDDCRRVFAARVIRGYDDKVASLSGGASHHWPLGAITISSASKDGNYPAIAAGGEVAREAR